MGLQTVLVGKWSGMQGDQLVQEVLHEWEECGWGKDDCNNNHKFPNHICKHTSIHHCADTHQIIYTYTYLYCEEYEDSKDSANSQSDGTNSIDQPERVDFQVGLSVEKVLEIK